MSGIGLNTNVGGIVQVEKDNTKVVNTQPKVEEKKATIAGDSLQTSGLKKDPVWEGVKLETKKGVKVGLIGGAAGGAVITALGVGITTSMITKVAPGTAVKAILIGAGIGAGVGALGGAFTGAVDGAVTGKIVEHSAKKAEANGTDAGAEVAKTAKIVGAVAGAAYGAKSAWDLSKSFSNPYAKAGIAVVSVGVGTLVGAVAAEKAAGAIYNKSK